MPAEKGVGADFKFGAPESSKLVSGGNNFKTPAKSVGKHPLTKHLGSSRRQKLRTESFQQTLENKPVGRENTFLQTTFFNRNT